MKILKRISEDEVMAVFLQSEINSPRWKNKILDFLRKDRRSRKIIDSPDLSDPGENKYRAKLMGNFRGYKRNEKLFNGFPEDIKWERVLLNRDELLKVKYIAWDYWLEVTGGSRMPADLARNIRSGSITGEEIKGFLSAAEKLKRGESFPELILVAADEKSGLVVLEGHLRLTAYTLEPGFIPEEIEVIIGFSEGIIKWGNYGAIS